MDYKFYVLAFLALLSICAFVFAVVMINKMVDSKYGTGVKLKTLQAEQKQLVSSRDMHEQAYMRLKEKYDIQEKLLQKFRGAANVP